MKTIVSLSLLLGLTVTHPTSWKHPSIRKREVPQEHSHEQFLTTVRASLQAGNPNQITDPVFGLLGNAAASQGLGKLTDPECLQQATADQAFTNAKAASDVKGMTAALIYRTLERNTGKVGLQSNSCATLTAENPEIAALAQHQDPASNGAPATNKAIVLELAKQIAGVGGDPQDALKSGTFAPGDPNDPTAKGNSCDDANDPVGCIFTQNLLVQDATPEEIDAAAAGVATGEGTGGNATVGAGGDTTGNVTGVVGAAPPPPSTAGNASNETICDTSPPPASQGKQGMGGRKHKHKHNHKGMKGKKGKKSGMGGGTGIGAGQANSNSTAGAGNAASAGNATDTGACAGTVSATLDLGSCSDPTIDFGPGNDGRKEDSFVPANKADFNHGSALNIKVITDFICQQLNDKCKAGTDTIAKCQQGAAAAQAVGGGKARGSADAFNAVFA